MFFGFDNSLIHLLRAVLIYPGCTKSFKVFIELIAVTPVESWSKAKGKSSSCDGTVGEFEQ
jgi:hypothetical protein